jgi:thioredoxin 2
LAHILRCSACGGLNRVDPARVDPTCGKCQTGLAAVPADMDDAALARLIRSSPVPVLVDFWAPWCGPCRSVAPHLEALAKAQAGELIIAKINVDEHKQHAGQLKVRGIPTLAVYVGGKPVKVESGARMGQALKDFVSPYLG